MAEVSKLDPGYLIGLFVIYVVLHLGIAFVANHYDKKSKGASLTADEQHTYKVATFLVKWFPGFYVLFLLWVL